MIRNKNFRLLWLAQIISAAGDTFSFLAIAIRIDDLSNGPGESAKALSLVLIAYALPTLLLGLVAGTFVDRWDRKRVMVVSDVARALIAPGYLLLQSSADLPIAIVTAFLLASFGVFFYPARTALLPSMVDDDELMSANGTMQLGNTIARLAGPALAGAVISVWSVRAAFWIDATSFLISAVLVLGIRGIVTQVATAKEAQQSTLQDLREGIRFAVQSHLLQGITLGIAVAMLGIGAVNVLFVPFLRDAFDAEAAVLGGIDTAQGAGMLLGALSMGVLGKRFSPLRISVVAMVGLGLGIGAAGMAPALGLIVAAMPLIGFTLPPLNASLSTMLQRGIPDGLLGRAGSVMEMASSLTNLISMGLAGWIAGVVGLRETFVLAGAIVLIAGIVMGWILKAEKSVHSDQEVTQQERGSVQIQEVLAGD
jgi:DHA3 family macrolide efflux protein-like MFS transporter